jgi:hypothetical protein
MKYWCLALLIGAVSGSAWAAGAAYFPSNLDPVKRLYIVYNTGNKELIKTYISILSVKNSSVSAADKMSMTIAVTAGQANELKALVPSDLTNNVEYYISDDAEIDDFGGTGDWLQDAGEFFYNDQNQLSFLHFSHSTPPPTIMFTFPHLLKNTEGVNLVSITDNAEDPGSVEGGNIEATPGGSVYVGHDLNSRMYEKIQTLVGKNRTLHVPTDHSNVGHVDESYQFLPATPESSNACGYVLAQSDYIDGLRIALAFNLMNGIDDNRGDGTFRLVLTDDYLEAISYFTGINKESIKFTNSDFLDLLKKFNFSLPFRPQPSLLGFRKEDVYIYKSFEVQKRIIEGSQLLSAQVAKEGCANLKKLSIPSLWTYGFNAGFPVMESEDVVKSERISNLTAFTNFVVIGDTLVIPDAKVPTQLFFLHNEEEFAAIGTKLKEILVTRLQEIGFNKEDIHFPNVAGSILGDGAAHCKTNILRRKK